MPAKSATSKPKKLNPGQFKPGQSGNPRGTRKKMDTWSSAFSGIGTYANDKRMSHEFAPTVLSYQDLIDIVEGDDLGERAVKAPIDDCFRQGFEISITDEGEFDDLKTDIEDELRNLDAVAKIKKAFHQKRALGGSAILIGAKDHKPLSMPLDRKTMRGIEFLTVLEPMMLQPYAWYERISDPKYGEVKMWQIQPVANGWSAYSGKAVKTMSTEKQGNAKNSYLVHESRLIMLNADKISAHSVNQSPAGDFWGPSILVRLYDVLRDFNISWAAAGIIVTEFNQGVFGIENLMGFVSRDPQGVYDRMLGLSKGKSVANAMVIDKDKESFENKSINVSGLPDLLIQLSRRLAASIDIPLSLLMGGGEKSATADIGDELRYYYDKCADRQVSEIEPILRLIISAIIRGLRERKIPKRWTIKWNPLWQLTDEQKANARLAQARVDSIYIDKGVLDPQTVALARFTGEYSFDTPLAPGYKAPGFMALPPQGVLIDGLDPNTGLPPGEVPPTDGDGAGGGTKRTAGVAVKPYARNKPRKINAAKTPDSTAGGATAGKSDEIETKDGHCEGHDALTDMETCVHCPSCEDCTETHFVNRKK